MCFCSNTVFDVLSAHALISAQPTSNWIAGFLECRRVHFSRALFHAQHSQSTTKFSPLSWREQRDYYFSNSGRFFISFSSPVKQVILIQAPSHDFCEDRWRLLQLFLHVSKKPVELAKCNLHLCDTHTHTHTHWCDIFSRIFGGPWREARGFQ